MDNNGKNKLYTLSFDYTNNPCQSEQCIDVFCLFVGFVKNNKNTEHFLSWLCFQYFPGLVLICSVLYKWVRVEALCKQLQAVICQLLVRPLCLRHHLSFLRPSLREHFVSVILHFMTTCWKELVNVHKWINVWKLAWVPLRVWFGWSPAAYVGNHRCLLDSLTGTQ